jgi:hypothetical protein
MVKAIISALENFILGIIIPLAMLIAKLSMLRLKEIIMISNKLNTVIFKSTNMRNCFKPVLQEILKIQSLAFEKPKI